MHTDISHFNGDILRQKGIVLTNIPNYATEAVAELTISALLNISRQTHDALNFVKQGNWGFEKFLGWFFNVYIITDERVIDVDFYSLLYKQISDAGLDKIQDMTYRTNGIAGSVINYGDILIQTAGEQPNLEFEAVPRPAEVVKILNELITQEEQDMLDGRAR